MTDTRRERVEIALNHLEAAEEALTNAARRVDDARASVVLGLLETAKNDLMDAARRVTDARAVLRSAFAEEEGDE